MMTRSVSHGFAEDFPRCLGERAECGCHAHARRGYAGALASVAAWPRKRGHGTLRVDLSATTGTNERRALTLAELVIVLAILTTVSAIVLPMAGNFVADSRDAVTRQSLTRLRDVIAETYWQDNRRELPCPGTVGVSSGRQEQPQLRYLFVNPSRSPEDAAVTFDPVYRLGWRGPYLVERNEAVYTIDTAAGFSDRYGEDGDPTVLDGWGHPIVMQNPGQLSDGRQDVRLVSAGPDGILNTPPATLTDSLTSTTIGDDLLISFQVR